MVYGLERTFKEREKKKRPVEQLFVEGINILYI